MGNYFAVRDRDVERYRLLKKVLAGRITLAAAAAALGVCYRHAKRLKAKVAAGDLRALAHGNRGRPPSNRRSPDLRQRVLALSQESYPGCNDTHFAELLAEREGIVLSRETVRCWRREAGIKPKRPRRAPKHRRRRERRRAAGMMMLWDGSPHHWFGPEQPPCCLMAAVDDATSALAGLLFVPRESSWAYLKLLQIVIERHGVPHSVYQDCHSALRRNDDRWTLEEELAGRQDPTQVGAALEALAIQPIFALSPQAKGRVERQFETLQDRLVQMLALDKITDLGAANAYATNGFLGRYNGKFAVPPQDSVAVWRSPPPAPDLERILAMSYRATVHNDNTVRFAGRVIDIPPGPRQRSYARARVQVLQLLDGSWRVYYQQQLIGAAPPTEIAELTRTHRRRKGTRAAYDAAHVFQSSAPGVVDCEPADPDLRPSPAAKLGPRTPSSLKMNAVRRAGPGQIIKGTRIA